MVNGPISNDPPADVGDFPPASVIPAVLDDGAGERSNATFTVDEVINGPKAYTDERIAVLSTDVNARLAAVEDYHQSYRTGNYTLDIVDTNGVVEVDSTGPAIITVPKHSDVAIPIRAIIPIYRIGAGTVTIVPADPAVRINPEPTRSINKQFGRVELYQRAVDDWVLTGDLNVSIVRSIVDGFGMHDAPSYTKTAGGGGVTISRSIIDGLGLGDTMTPDLSSPRVPALIGHFQDATGSDATTTSTTFADATGVPTVTFTPVADGDGDVQITLNCTFLTNSGIGSGKLRARWHDGTAPVPGTECNVQANSVRYRHEVTKVVTGLPPGVTQTWKLQIAAGASGVVCGVKRGADYPILALVYDMSLSMAEELIAYGEDISLGGLTSNLTSTALVKMVEQGSATWDFPTFVGPASGLILVTAYGQAVTSTPGSAEYIHGIWDNDTGVEVPNSREQVAGGAGSRRCRPTYRRLIAVNPGQTYHWSMAHAVAVGTGSTASNVVGMKFGDDTHEGPGHIFVEAVAA